MCKLFDNPKKKHSKKELERAIFRSINSFHFFVDNILPGKNFKEANEKLLGRPIFVDKEVASAFMRYFGAWIHDGYTSIIASKDPDFIPLCEDIYMLKRVLQDHLVHFNILKCDGEGCGCWQRYKREKGITVNCHDKKEAKFLEIVKEFGDDIVTDVVMACDKIEFSDEVVFCHYYYPKELNNKKLEHFDTKYLKLEEFLTEKYGKKTILSAIFGRNEKSSGQK